MHDLLLLELRMERLEPVSLGDVIVLVLRERMLKIGHQHRGARPVGVVGGPQVRVRHVQRHILHRAVAHVHVVIHRLVRHLRHVVPAHVHALHVLGESGRRRGERYREQ